MRRLLVALVVLAVLLVATDRIAAAAAARAVAEHVQRSESLPQRPRVTIGGVPFFTQALQGRYRDVRLRVDGRRRGDVRVARMDARLAGVRLSIGAALRDRPAAVPVDHADASALLRYADLSAALPERQLALGEQNGRLRLRGTFTLAGQRYAATAVGSVRLSDDEVTVTPTGLRFDGAAAAPLAATPVALARFTFTVRIELPLGLRLSALAVRPDGLVVSAAGSHVTLEAAPRAAMNHALEAVVR